MKQERTHYTVEEAAARTGFSVATIRRRIKAGTLKGEKRGRAFLISAQEFDRLPSREIRQERPQERPQESAGIVLPAEDKNAATGTLEDKSGDIHGHLPCASSSAIAALVAMLQEKSSKLDAVMADNERLKTELRETKEAADRFQMDNPEAADAIRLWHGLKGRFPSLMKAYAIISASVGLPASAFLLAAKEDSSFQRAVQ